MQKLCVYVHLRVKCRISEVIICDAEVSDRAIRSSGNAKSDSRRGRMECLFVRRIYISLTLIREFRRGSRQSDRVGYKADRLMPPSPSSPPASPPINVRLYLDCLRISGRYRFRGKLRVSRVVCYSLVVVGEYIPQSANVTFRMSVFEFPSTRPRRAQITRIVDICIYKFIAPSMLSTRETREPFVHARYLLRESIPGF